MKTWRRIQKTAVAVGMTYGLWLGCNESASDRDIFSGMVIVVLTVVVALSMLLPEARQEGNL
ncbi:hypothetical protein [Bacteroides fragilis]|uniref:hypothetical protein n=1 Tax=Bacteroides fragilis TaxID=817 RepID=UPI00202ECEC9|nr:hypothetical protein [Bacteroides fragilis]MCM0315912.1 hypothetical protein [Bacteroides fragilis]